MLTGQPRKYDIIPLLTDVAQSAVKEKVVRVIIATFRVRLTVDTCLLSNSSLFIEPRLESSRCESPLDVGRQASTIRQEPFNTKMVG
jgi:hypothetical protein